MLTDPQSITINSVAISMPKIVMGPENALYRSSDRTVTLNVGHQHNKGRTRSMYRVDQSKITPDPLTAENMEVKAGIYLVIDKPDFGFTETDIINLLTGIVGAISASSYSLAKKINAGES